jgi:pyridoxal biosynthesis lyase PdxS
VGLIVCLQVVAAVSENLGEAMVGINCDELLHGNKTQYNLSEVPE